MPLSAPCNWAQMCLKWICRAHADREFILMHDRTVDRTTDGRGAVASLTLRELKDLDAGYGWTPDSGRTFPYRGQGITIPTLKEVFAAFPKTRLNIEIKAVDDPLIQSFCQELRTAKMTHQTLVASFRGSAIAEFRRHCPEVATSASSGEVIKFLALQKIALPQSYNASTQAFQVPVRWSVVNVLTKGFVNGAHARNMQVHAWTIDEPEEMRRLIGLGVDGIITDYPDRLLNIVKRPE
ncbi:MAG: glycerophosphodiester phosphodiesterase [Pyrinomonadaceae bacterium]